MRWLREPLLWFLLAGSALFALANRGEDAEPVVVSEADEQRLAAQWQAQMGRPPTAAELEGLVEQHIREEIYYREAKRMGLDRNDTIIRRRLAQKLRFVTEDLAVPPEPGAAELEAFYAEHAERYRQPSRFSFEQRYFSADRRDDAEAAASASAAAGEAGDPGDPFMLQGSYRERSARQIADLFGGPFAMAVAGLSPGKWSGPVRSAYGWHAVKLSEKLPELQLTLAQARDEVVADWQQARREAANEAFYAELRGRYDVVRP